MVKIKSLNTLLKNIKPKLVADDFVFCTLREKKYNTFNVKPVLAFREKEGVTIVVKKKEADTHGFSYSGVWSLITLSVNSDLSAVGFLATISKALANEKIPVNVVSAFYHDHIFVPSGKTEKALKILGKFSSKS